MKVKEFAEKTQWSYIGDEAALDKEISGVFCGDLLSWEMGNAKSGQLWLTVQTHLNVVAVAQLKEISALIIVSGAQAEAETIERAKEEGLAIFQIDQSAYEACCACHALGL